jgi:hypothetical protein
MLIMEVMALAGEPMDGANCDNLCWELIQRYGSVESALVAVKAGACRLEKDHDE